MTQFAKLPKSTGYPHKEEAEASVYLIKSDSFIHSTASGTVIFSLPPNCVLVELAIKPVTAWNADAVIEIDDSGANRLMRVAGLVSGLAQTTQPIVQKLYREFSAETDIVVNIFGAPTTGAAEVWAMYRVHSNKMNPLATAG